MSIFEPSAYVPEAVNCCEEPTSKLSGVVGVTAIEDNIGVGTIIKVTTGLVMLDKAAVIFVFPTALPVAKP